MFQTRKNRLIAAFTFAVISVVQVVSVSKSADDPVKRGGYLVSLMGCNDCHTPGYFKGAPEMSRQLSGSDVGWQIPGLGYFYGANITPDRKTGIGAWTDDQILIALRTGTRPDGRELAPVMPWRAFAGLTDGDARAIVAYLRTLPAVQNAVPGPFGPTEKPTLPYFALNMPGK